MKNMMFLIVSSVLFIYCKKEKVKIENKELIINKDLQKSLLKKEIDTSKIEILIFKKNKTKNDQFLMLKNAAYCLCINDESQEIMNSNRKENYKLISDKSFVSYAENSGLDIDLFYKNKRLDKLIKAWSKKQYNLKPKEESSESTSFIIQMKCLDFYHSKELNSYIDSLKNNN